MMAQYLEIKGRYPQALLFYRMGDFYELFFDDAVAAAEALDIALTKRGKHAGEDIPMCGVPHHSAENYLLTLIRKGFRVAVCEQMESPEEAKKRGSKSVVQRDVVRLVTPGTLSEETLLDARRHNFLAAYSEIRGEAGLAWIDMSTGDFRVMPCARVRLGPELARLGPSEIIFTDAQREELGEIAGEQGVSVSELGKASFDSEGAAKRLCSFFEVETLEAFGQFSRAEISALGAVLDYLEITQKGRLPLLQPPVREALGGTMQIDAATRRNLELTQGMQGGRAGSLLGAIDRTLTAPGARLLERRLSSPSCDGKVIAKRLDAVARGAEDSSLLGRVRDVLRHVPDMDRALSRLGLERGGPRDIAAIRNGLERAEELGAALGLMDLPALLGEAAARLQGHEALTELLGRALVAEPPLLARDGGFAAEGYDKELDECRRLRDEGRGVIAQMQRSYVEQTGINALKIKHNNVLGYFVEVTATHAEKMLAAPLNETFKHRQTTANQVRFTTVELSEMETRILNAGGRAVQIEQRIFAELRGAILEAQEAVFAATGALAEIDLAMALATIAREEDWTRPQVDESRRLEIDGGRHPVVEQALRVQGSEGFVPNDCALTEKDSLWLLTGPNMAGKSTFLRQNALIAVLAQMGSFVPAKAAHVGIVSQLFSRVGASDDLARGRSTFMVEMVETAAILNQADDRALVILDEIGRGTATYDGLSIAWATLEHLHEVNGCRALFATHYHEMTRLSEKLDRCSNATVMVKEWEGAIIFLHEVRKGVADRSYGVQVAKLAGLPDSVIARARVVLDALEKGERESGQAKAVIDDLPLFSATPAPQPAPAKSSEIETELAQVYPDEMTPREALQVLYDLKAKLGE
ncbi:DNA mismatch repair protein MutS [Rhodobacteraceae bacterium 63075]|nr:DNA mismatch repair protein MutS [Rhodobacteraceae bacterium 63075]